MRNMLPRRLLATILMALSLAMMADAAQADYTLYDNSASASAGTDPATSTAWLADSFSTGLSATPLASITLQLANPSAGTAVVEVYTDGGLQPGTLVGTLSSPTQFTTGLSSETFTASNIILSANSTYWVVLQAISGEFAWSYASDSTGSGIGFQADYAQSPDAGSSWFYYADSPYQMTVTAAGTTSPSVPEPGSLLLSSLAGALMLGSRIAGCRRPRARAA